MADTPRKPDLPDTAEPDTVGVPIILDGDEHPARVIVIRVPAERHLYLFSKHESAMRRGEGTVAWKAMGDILAVVGDLFVEHGDEEWLDNQILAERYPPEGFLSAMREALNEYGQERSAPAPAKRVQRRR
jgi:hypothetical protein